MSDAPKAVFLSYAREDTEPAKRIADALRAFGVEVWFDQSELRGGDSWDQKIRSQIRTCALFVPIISARTQDRAEGYFRREWKLAVERTHDMATGVAFIVPIVIDETTESAAAVPDEFMRFQWTRLAHGVPTPAFVEQIKRLLETPRKPPLAAPRTPTASAVTPTARPFRATWIAATAALIAVLVGLALLWRRAGDNPTPPKSGTTAKPAAIATTEPAARLPADDKSVAVLAFADLTEGHTNDYLADGVSEEILNVLAKTPGLRVAARTSAFYFKGKNVPIAEIARTLNVAYVIEGSVRRAGERVRITAQLIKAADGYHVWSDNFDRDLKDAFAVQDEIAGLIAKNLSLQLGTAPKSAPGVALDPEAYRLYLEGRQAWNLRTKEGFTRAEQLLTRALERQPDFARAIGGLADVRLMRDQGRLANHLNRNSPELAEYAAQAEHALAIDPNLAEPHATLAMTYQFRWRFADADREFQRAIALNPAYATAHQWRSLVLLILGRPDEALAESRQSVEADPLAPRGLSNAAMVSGACGRLAESIALNDRALELQPGPSQQLFVKAEMLAALGRKDEALRIAREVAALDPTRMGAYLYVYSAAGGAAEEIQNADAQLTVDGSAARVRALLVQHQPDQALLTLVASQEQLSTPALIHLLYHPLFDPVRRDPRFVAVLRHLELTEAHERVQAWRAAHPGEWTGFR